MQPLMPAGLVHKPPADDAPKTVVKAAGSDPSLRLLPIVDSFAVVVVIAAAWGILSVLNEESEFLSRYRYASYSCPFGPDSGTCQEFPMGSVGVWLLLGWMALAFAMRFIVGGTWRVVPALMAMWAAAVGLSAPQLVEWNPWTAYVGTIVAIAALVVPMAIVLFDLTAGRWLSDVRTRSWLPVAMDIANGLVVCGLAFIWLPWIVVAVEGGWALLGIALGITLGSIRWFVRRGWESVAPGLVIAAVGALVPPLFRWWGISTNSLRFDLLPISSLIGLILAMLATGTLLLALAHRSTSNGAAQLSPVS